MKYIRLVVCLFSEIHVATWCEGVEGSSDAYSSGSASTVCSPHDPMATEYNSQVR